jgi:hypothetical protein
MPRRKSKSKASDKSPRRAGTKPRSPKHNLRHRKSAQYYNLRGGAPSPLEIAQQIKDKLKEVRELEKQLRQALKLEEQQRKQNAVPFSQNLLQTLQNAHNAREAAEILAKEFDGSMSAHDFQVNIEKIRKFPDLLDAVVDRIVLVELRAWIRRGDIPLVSKTLELIENSQLDEPIEYGTFPDYFNDADGNEDMIKLLFAFAMNHNHHETIDGPFSENIYNDKSIKVLQSLERAHPHFQHFYEDDSNTSDDD